MHRQHSLQPFSRHYSHTTNPFLDLLDIDDSFSTPSSQSNGIKDDGSLFPPPACFTPSTSKPTECTLPSNTLPTTIKIREPHLNPMISLLQSYKIVRSKNLLYSLSFITVHDYLFLLRGVSKILAEPSIGRNCMFYLAAAVSDFFIPHQKMVSCRNALTRKLLNTVIYSRFTKFRVARAR